MRWVYAMFLIIAMTHAVEFSQHLKSRGFRGPTERQLILEMRKIISNTLEVRAQTPPLIMTKREEEEEEEIPIFECSEGLASHDFFRRAKKYGTALRRAMEYPDVQSEAVVCINGDGARVARAIKKGDDDDDDDKGDYDNLAVPLGVTIFIVAIPGISILMIFAMMLISCYFSQTGEKLRRMADLSK